MGKIEIIGGNTKAGREHAEKYPDPPRKPRRGQIGRSRCILYYKFDAETDKAVHAAVKRLTTVLEQAGYDTSRMTMSVPRKRKAPQKGS